ncbi:hypothetical protein [Actinoplanes utahensis]|nr:hypothetical protein [Actinoplanes utahensis]GIF31275.1 hypothetical protein Aut01nite_42610 [Actinoplanes utahensis]
MGASNPYPDGSVGSTGAPWLDGNIPVDIDLDGLREYATRMASHQKEISSRAGYLTTLSQIPQRAFDGEVLGEADAVRAQLLANAGEMTIYLQKLAESVGNIANAARVVADSYGSSDAMAAASLNDVLFAFGDKSVPRPAGLPEGVGRTFQEQQAATGPVPPPASSPLWQPSSSTRISAYQTLETATGPNGERRDVLTFSPPGGPVTTTTTVYDSKGEKVSAVTGRATTRQVDDVEITVEDTFGADGRQTGTTETRTRFDENQRVEGRSTDVRDADGNTVHRTTEFTDANSAERITVTEERDEKGGIVETNRVNSGVATEGQDHVGPPIADPYRVRG